MLMVTDNVRILCYHAMTKSSKQLSEKSSNRHGSIVSNGVLYHVRNLILLLFLTTALHESDTAKTFS